MNGFKTATQKIKSRMNLLNLEMIDELTYQNSVLEEAVAKPISQQDWMKFRGDIRSNTKEIENLKSVVEEYERQRKLLEYGEKVVGY